MTTEQFQTKVLNSLINIELKLNDIQSQLEKNSNLSEILNNEIKDVKSSVNPYKLKVKKKI